MDWILVLCLLMLAHFLADYPLQGDFLAKYKHQYPYIMFVHCFIWTGLISIVLSYFGIFAWWKAIMLFGGHWMMDWWKSGHPTEERYMWTFYVDQSFHFGQLLFCLFL